MGPRRFGNQTIQQNGNADNRDSGGILGRGNSHLDLFSASVVNNRGVGLAMRDNSSARLGGDTVTGNTAGGVNLLILSSTELLPGNNITGNGITDLKCRLNSFALGDRSGIGMVSCPVEF